MPPFNYEPQHDDSIFSNLADLIYRFEHTDGATKFRMGYIYENVDDSIRPVLYVIHKAVMTAEANKSYKVRKGFAQQYLRDDQRPEGQQPHDAGVERRGGARECGSGHVRQHYV